MATLEERFQRGIGIRTKFGGGTPVPSTVPDSRELAPDLHRIAGEALFGSIWTRPALTLEHREMITLSVLTVLERDTQLKRHVGNAVNLGLSPDQIVEVLIHMAFYRGVPATYNALAIAKDVFDQRGINFTPPSIYDPTEDPEDLYQRGVARRTEYMGAESQVARSQPVTDVEREFSRLTNEYYWGSVWTRPGLDLASRSICTLAALIALGQAGPLRSHIKGARHIGLSQEEVVEVIVHTAFYVGLPFVRSAMDIANEIFRAE
jgi:4-carboxymuconolactone decarboxylase